MNEADARAFFNSLPVDERLRVLRDIIGDIERKVVLDAASPSFDLFPGDALPDLPLPGELEALNAAPDGGSGNSGRNIHELRLKDAVEHLRGLLKKYGYVQGLPSPSELARMIREAESAARRKGRRSAWAEWVARDEEKPDRPASHDWETWVTKEDEAAEAKKLPD